MNPEMKIIREVNIHAEGFYKDAVSLGDHATYAFQDLSHSKKNSHRSQMTGLENIANSALKTSDVFDYIKKQTARSDYWRKGLPGSEKPQQGFGERLKNYLESELPRKRDGVCDRVGISKNTEDEKWERQRIYLLLIRQFIRQMVVQFEYRTTLEEGANSGTND